ncbi:heavy metal-binding domain-containing protein [Sabulibacter ruber]|uniref:heavy metal-binding domain-containing protein n=1 Tax=Sabulibacter ruber TaxID=2811901 RepID=UPI001A979B66|nr:heavy metal-binding domain-containing protein [Sabulibacter ruber]
MRKIFFTWALALSAVVSVSSCNNASSGDQPETTATEQEGAAQDSTAAGTQTQQLAYICPMECEGSASMEPGKCPVCGMDLEKNPKYQASADTTATR